ncbi:MAG: polysaccharide deacetylase family protein [Muribaculum sp.]|nr:polysaccharide deacetylase family protein [Muribaculum sp.]
MKLKLSKNKLPSKSLSALLLSLCLWTGCGRMFFPETPLAPAGESPGEETSLGVPTATIPFEIPKIPAAFEGAAKGVWAAEMPETEPFIDRLTQEGVGWGLSFGEAGAQPAGNASPEELAQYSAYFMGNAEENVIYLTFDCGYENGNTQPILDALRKHQAPATFFVVGHYLETEPELVRQMVEDGHAVGSHTYHHPDINTLDQAAFRQEMDDVAELFADVTGQELSPYYRPPEGKCGIANLKMAQELGYHTILWSLAHVDWDTGHQPDRQEALEKLTTRIHPGAIVLLHNTSRTNGEILDELLTEWEEMGYTFMPLSHLTEEGRV